MKWAGISGSWRKSSEELERDLRREIEAVLRRGGGIVTGGALGVDFIATELALEHAPDGSRIRVILPTTLAIYSAHYRKRAAEGVIEIDQAERLAAQLERVKALGSLVELDHQEVTEHTYHLRNTEVVRASDELLAFQVNQSGGVQDTVGKARQRGIPVRVLSYTVE